MTTQRYSSFRCGIEGRVLRMKISSRSSRLFAFQHSPLDTGTHALHNTAHKAPLNALKLLSPSPLLPCPPYQNEAHQFSAMPPLWAQIPRGALHSPGTRIGGRSCWMPGSSRRRRQCRRHTAPQAGLHMQGLRAEVAAVGRGRASATLRHKSGDKLASGLCCAKLERRQQPIVRVCEHVRLAVNRAAM